MSASVATVGWADYTRYIHIYIPPYIYHRYIHIPPYTDIYTRTTVQCSNCRLGLIHPAIREKLSRCLPAHVLYTVYPIYIPPYTNIYTGAALRTYCILYTNIYVSRIVYPIYRYTTVYRHIYWCLPAQVLYTVYGLPYTNIYTVHPIYIPPYTNIYRIPIYTLYTNIYTAHPIYIPPYTNIYTVYQYIYLTPNIYTTVYQHIYGCLPAAYKSHFTRKNCHLMFPFSSSNCSYGLFPGLAPPLRFVNMDLMPI